MAEESMIGTPKERKKSIEDARKGRIGGTIEIPGAEGVKRLFDEVMSHAEPELADKASGFLGKAESFFTDTLPPYLKDGWESIMNAPGWQRLGALGITGGTIYGVFRDDIGDATNDFLRLYYRALARAPFPFGSYGDELKDDAFSQEFDKQVLSYPMLAASAIGVDLLDLFPWYHRNRPTLDIKEIPIPIIGNFIERTVGVAKVDLFDLLAVYWIAQQTGTTNYFFRTREGLTKTVVSAGIEAIQTFGAYKIFLDVSGAAQEAFGYLARINSRYDKRQGTGVGRYSGRRTREVTDEELAARGVPPEMRGHQIGYKGLKKG